MARRFSQISRIDDLVKSLKRRIFVIPANPGSGPGQAPESSYFKIYGDLRKSAS
jgi:hypothetical protein